MTRRTLTLAAIALAITATPASAMTQDQLIEQAEWAGVELALGVSSLTGQTATSYYQDCRRTTRRRGSCTIGAYAGDTRCTARIVVRQTPAKRLWTSWREESCLTAEMAQSSGSEQ